ncbi:hypothetical protein [Pseudomonas sp.]|uniref:hypothetical protein n=1 Tax=Pseudomonas sp. TaxID=306 RepID=UPI0028A65F59|nr:hypothetical protein [Pseudomonas sp.]
MNGQDEKGFSRRSVMAMASTLAVAAPFLGVPRAMGEETSEAKTTASPAGAPQRRKLGSLEVSSVGLGVQNMSRTYQTTIPNRAEMHRIIRSAFEQGTTFYDAAEAYGPYEAPGQIAPAWLLAQKPWIVPIPGTTQMAHMLENGASAQLRFSPAELAELNAAVRAIQVQGARFPDLGLFRGRGAGKSADDRAWRGPAKRPRYTFSNERTALTSPSVTTPLAGDSALGRSARMLDRPDRF